MKVPSVSQLREWDEYTIRHSPIASIDLMERAAAGCCNWILNHIPASQFVVLAGTGNNGGDGLAIARMLHLAGKSVRIVIVGKPENGSDDFRHNFKQCALFPELSVSLYLHGENSFLPQRDEWIIDALIGSGLSRPVEGDLAAFIDSLAPFSNRTISIDLPSGMNADLLSAQESSVMQATYTLTFQVPKRAFFFGENEKYTGTTVVLDIGLEKSFAQTLTGEINLITSEDIGALLHARKKFAYKNQFGHLQIIAGSIGKMGAAVLCSTAAMRAGCGLVTACIPSSGTAILQSAIPEVMCIPDDNAEYLYSTLVDNTISALAIGPGISQQPETSLMLRKIISDSTIPMVMDADALNIIAKKDLIEKLPKKTILTPHVGEFDRLFGTHTNSFDRLTTQQKMSADHSLIIVLKGAHSTVTLPDGELFFNSTGNPGMATAGSGDVLTGVIGSLLAQGYSPEVAAIAGVYLHGLSGDLVAEEQGMAGMLAGDIARSLPRAIQQVFSGKSQVVSSK